ncbi:hypothetical protein PV04_02678 [Phialophora macrospora]|uniref:Non-homologous end-joining factor 1 n=1 Tax=Phialophora macrospora TaxID=1851006 RepID=A0A0D2CYX1_9EURO|nr:hypothetical protein PV04_02678 [Phialophora macrospora]
MSESVVGGWQELQTLSRRQCPKLFYQFSTDQESLTVLLTDLISIWETSLDSYDIKAAAARQRTTVDPSASSRQFEVLLSKLRQSLSDGKNTITRGSGRNSQILHLRTRIDLPHPLNPLDWTFTLEPQTSPELAERILHPSLREVAVSQSKIDSLLAIVKEKDHVISKLLDRIGNSAVDLSLVFPGIAGLATRKGGHVSVADAKKRVPGMADFDEGAWIKQFADDDGYEGADRTGLSNLVRGCEKCFAHSKSEHEKWVKDLPTTSEMQSGGKDDAQVQPPPIELAEENSGAGDESAEDEFERQPTPPHLKAISPASRRAARQTMPPVRRASTTSTETATATASQDEDKDVRTPSRGGTKSPRPARTRGLNKKGAATRSPSATPSPSPSASASPSPLPTRSHPRHSSPTTSKRGEHDDETETEADDEDDDLDRSPLPSPVRKPKFKSPTPATGQTPRRLGRLGARKTQPPPDPGPASDEDDSPAKPEKTQPSPKPGVRRLGALRKRREQDRDRTSSPPATEADSRPRATDSPKSPSASMSISQRHKSPVDQSPPRETAEEAASRRRMQLKRTIEAGAAGRKKRRF